MKPIAERGVVVVDVAGGIDEVGVVPITLGHRVVPFVERLRREAEGPAGHRDGEPVRGQVEDQREPHFEGSSRAKNAAARRRISFSYSSCLVRLRSSRSSANSSRVRPGLLPSSMSACLSQLCRQVSEIPTSLATYLLEALSLRATATTSRWNSPALHCGSSASNPRSLKSWITCRT